MRESNYTRAINRLLPREVYAWKISDRFTSGIPDAWYSGPRGDVWVEYKYKDRLAKTVQPQLTALQNKWLNERLKEGRNVAVIVGSPTGAIMFLDGEWTGKKPADKNKKTKREIAEWIAATVAGNKARCTKPNCITRKAKRAT